MAIKLINFNRDFPEHRSARELAVDVESARRQVGALTHDDGHSGTLLDTIVGLIQNRQEAAFQAGNEYALRFVKHLQPTVSGHNPYVLVARGQIVARVAPDKREEVTRIVGDMGYSIARNRSTDGKVRDPDTIVFERDTDDPKLVADDIEKLAVEGVDAAMNPIVPLGHIIKGDDYPAPTVRRPFSAAVRTVAPGAVTAGSIRVAIVDTGITPEMRTDRWLDTVARTTENVDFLDILPIVPDGRLDWFSGHGTFTAGVVQQVAPGCEIVAYRFTTSDGLGMEKDVAEALLRAAEEARRDKVRLVINASVGVAAVDGRVPPALAAAIERIHTEYPEVLIVASAGNSGTPERMYPAAFDGVVAVGALEHDLRPAPFSNWGPWVDCSTVGVGVISTFVEGIEPPEARRDVADVTFPPDSWGLWSGTSFSAPQIAGVVARLCQENPGHTPREVFDAWSATLPLDDDKNPRLGRIVRLLPGTPTS
jgi:subtilisin family serine protease